MSVYLESDFCSADDGLDYIFGKMGAIYGASFSRHWDGVDLRLVRDTWKEMLGVYATYKPTIDFERGLTETVNWYLENEKWWRGLKKK
jgi:dTDP-D-glucose 4,6-dehydratase